jgi:hydroxyethylthiazole kinase
MMLEKIDQIRKAVKGESPLIHCITNPISIQACANTVLALGARPVMAEHPDEVAEITKTAQALVLNLGNITDVRMRSMPIAATVASEKNIPMVLDTVGVACSKHRRIFANTLLSTFPFATVKGNYSEIYALYQEEYHACGVDADETLEEEKVLDAAVHLARSYRTVLLASGKTDIITDGRRCYYIKNGTEQLARVTGTGDMLGVLCGCYLAAKTDIMAVVAACAMLGVCGELAETTMGSGSFMVNLMDRLSRLKREELFKYVSMEEKDEQKENINF